MAKAKGKAKGRAKADSLAAKAKSTDKASAKAANQSGKTKLSKNPNRIQINSDVWPLERDVMFRPDRLKYVRKLIKTEGCVFCKAAKSEAPDFDTLCVHKTEHSILILNKFPYNPGHLLVLPKIHQGDLVSLSSVAYQDLHELLREAIKALQQVYQPGGINVGLNMGAVAGAGIPDHLHYHAIPRWSGDLNFFPLIAETKTVVESLETTFDRLVAYFKNESK